MRIHVTIIINSQVQYTNGGPSSAPTALNFVTLHTYRGKFDKSRVFMNMHEAGETNLLPIKSHVTIKYSPISSNLLMPNKSLALAKGRHFEW